MTKNYIGAAPFTMARTELGGYVNILGGDPVPEGIEPSDLTRLVDEGFLAEAPEVVAVLIESVADPKPGSPEFILAEVGADKALAQVALDEETAKPRPRKGLVADLEKVLGAS